MSRRSIVIAIDGPAASGKSTTATLVGDELGFKHIDSGALYRKETARRVGSDDIRSPQVTAAVSRVAQVPEVRAQVNAEVRRIAETQNVVVDGRDMGSVVFPDAQLKIFLTADARERARRRLHQELNRPATEQELAAESARLSARDASDAANLIRAADAVVVDTTHLTQAEQVQQIVAMARKL